MTHQHGQVVMLTTESQPQRHKLFLYSSITRPVAVKVFETASHYVDTIFGCGVGGLIHAAVGSFGGCGGAPNRLGLAA